MKYPNIKTYGKGDKVWFPMRMLICDGSPYKKGDIKLIQLKISHAYISGMPLNKKETNWEIVISYRFEERYIMHTESNSVFGTLKEAKLFCDKNNFNVVYTMNYKEHMKFLKNMGHT